MNKIALIILSIALVIVFAIIFSGGSKKQIISVNNVEIKDGIQYIRIDAKGGYSPAVTLAKAGIPTKLLVQTNNTFDCSAALVVRDADFQGILPQNAETEIDLGIKQAGEKVEGVCGMGMYNFEINFEV
ncbi:MAG: hypothetical protein WCT29_00450 [Candidatus Paceibacterota bacterium]|jgi:plastocyanin domain-containing protein